jgi:subtilisin family serine protease
LALALFSLCGVASAAASSEPLGKYIVAFKDSVEHPGTVAHAQVDQHAGDMNAFFQTAFSGYAATLPKDGVALLRRDPRVQYVTVDQTVSVAAVKASTGVRRVSAVSNSELSLDGIANRTANVDVAIIDTGIDYKHKSLNVAGYFNCTTGTCIENSGTDGYVHGTHVAGIIGALDNGIGSTGIAPGARIWSMKVFTDSGSGSESNIVKAVEWVVAHSSTIEVANLSIEGGPAVSLDKAINSAVESGVVVVVAAGNENVDANEISPASNPNAITVSAISDYNGLPGGKAIPTECFPGAGPDDSKAEYSNWGSAIDIAAPGTCIESTLPGDNFGYMSGTSMAAPFVAGAAAIIASRWGKNPASKADVEAIRNTLVAKGNSEWTDTSGDGIKEPLLNVSDESTFSLLEPPKNTALPAVSPTTPVQGTSVSTTTGTWVNGSPSYSYQWQRCNAAGAECVSIVGATKSTYVPVKADREKTLVSKVTATNSGGQTSASSVATSKVVTTIEWELTPVPLPGGTGSSVQLNGVSCPVSTTACVGVGGYVSSTWKPLAEHWDGSEWAPQVVPMPAGSGNNPIVLNDVSCTSASFCLAAGFYKTNASATPRALIEIWNGTEWKIQTTPEPAGALNSTLEGISCTSTTACTVVGTYKSSAGVVSSLAERWNGTEWKIQTTPNPAGAKETEATDVSCASATSCVMVGDYVNSSSVKVPFAEAWNGTTWSIQTVPNPVGSKATETEGVSCTAATACTLVGTNATGGTPAAVGFIARWNGAEWKSQAPAVPSGSGVYMLNGVSCISGTVCTATGLNMASPTSPPTGTFKSLAQRWNGTEWVVQKTPNGTYEEGWLMGVSCRSSTFCAAVGNSGGTTLAEIYN